jgi:hypothetical protein
VITRVGSCLGLLPRVKIEQVSSELVFTRSFGDKPKQEWTLQISLRFDHESVVIISDSLKGLNEKIERALSCAEPLGDKAARAWFVPLPTSQPPEGA